jgi:hypothetical protein
MKKIIPLLIIFALLAGGGFFAYKKLGARKEKEKPKTVTSKKRNPVNILELEKRPYITLTPRSDGHELSVTIDNLKHDEERVEYELEYQAGTMLQGAGGRIDFTEEPAPVTKNLLFGSCSKGKCKYDEDVNSGSLTLYFEGKEDYSLKGEFTLGKMAEKEGVFNSQDVKVSLDVGEKGLDDDTFMVVASTMGLPGKVKGKILAGPIGFFTAGSPDVEEATLTFKRIKEDLEGAQILGWDGLDWQEYEITIEDESASTTVNQLGTYILVTE